MNEFKVYGKPVCPYCVRAKALIELNGDKYTELVVEKTINLEAFKALFPEAKTVPQIVLLRKDGDTVQEHIGGFTELQAWYKASKDT